jgi:DnaJ-class molecular chaperone
MDIKTQTKIVIKVVEPELYAQVCPTCNGFGTLKHGMKVCNGCEGKTWILVPVRRDGNYGVHK